MAGMVRPTRGYASRGVVMSAPMDDYRALSDAVASAFVAELPEYLRRQGVDVRTIDQLVGAIAAELETWKQQGARDQIQTPLEIVRSVIHGVVDEKSLPMTSRDLGERSWKVHVAWGIGRAEAIAGMVPAPPEHPVAGVAIAIASTNLMDRTRIEETAGARNVDALVWRNPGAVADGLDSAVPAVAFVDLEHGAAHDLIRLFVDAGVRTIAYGPHVDDHALAAAAALGATEVLPRSIFFRRLESLIPTAV